MRKSKLVAVVAILFLSVFMAASAMAFQVTNRSAEMDDFSACDRAGTIKMNFTQADVDQITTWLATHDYALIRIALNGTDLPSSPTLPKLCKDITGLATSDGALADGNTIPNSGSLVALDEFGVEISDFTAAGTPDATMFVYGKTGDQYISVYITDVTNVRFDPSLGETSWFKIGLNEELVNADKTSICAQVLSFSGVSKLTISNEAFPNTLTFSGDNEIGHFLTQIFSLRDCDKTETCIAPSTPSITLCPLGTDPQQQDCPDYYKCFVAEGDYVPGDLIKVTVRTNGSTDGADTQNGVFLKAISLTDEAGVAIPTLDATGVAMPDPFWAFYKSDGITGAVLPCNAWEAEIAVAYVSSDDIVAVGNELRFCVTYTVNPLMAVAGTTAQIWATGETVPCGMIFNGVRNAAELLVCPTEGGGTELLFPYFVSLADGEWWNGIAIANLGSTAGKATFVAYVADGSTATVEVDVPANSIYTNLLPLMNWVGTGIGTAQCYIKVTTDFPADGFGMMANTNNNDSMGYLPRIPGRY